MNKAIENIPKTTDINQCLLKVGFHSAKFHPFIINNDLEDLFLYCGKNRPLIYLDPLIRNNIKTFKMFSSSLELKSGLIKLKEDINTGKIANIISKYSSSIGDFSFIVANKSG